jgi:hypothetical protein
MHVIQSEYTYAMQNACGDKGLDSTSRRLTREHTNEVKAPKIPIKHHTN